MATIQFTSNLKRFFPSLDKMQIEALTIKELVEELDKKHEGIKTYILDEQGALRKHVNIFVSGALIIDRQALSDTIKPDDEVFILQALSGG
jgi:molybdopterin converting factor small subunit